jgi:hypothetical protein
MPALASSIEQQHQVPVTDARPLPPLTDYSETRIGTMWTAEDHQHLMRCLGQIDQVCIEVWRLIADLRRG